MFLYIKYIIAFQEKSTKTKNKMKIIDEYHQIDNIQCRKEIDNSVELLTDLVHFNHKNLDDYTRYRMIKALEKIKMFNKEIKTK